MQRAEISYLVIYTDCPYEPLPALMTRPGFFNWTDAAYVICMCFVF